MAKGVYLQAIARALRPLETAGAREAFLHTLRAVIDIHGQRVSATDRLGLLERADDDHLGRARPDDPARARAPRPRGDPGSAFATIPGAAHFPHLEEPDELARAAAEFLRTSEPRWIEDGDWGAILARRSPPSR